jgi:hypothetical protein
MYFEIMVNLFYLAEEKWLLLTVKNYATSRKVVCSIPDEATGILNWPNPSSRTIALGSTEPLTEMSTRNFPGFKGRPARKAVNLTAICEPIV